MTWWEKHLVLLLLSWEVFLWYFYLLLAILCRNPGNFCKWSWLMRLQSFLLEMTCSGVIIVKWQTQEIIEIVHAMILFPFPFIYVSPSEHTLSTTIVVLIKSKIRNTMTEVWQKVNPLIHYFNANFSTSVDLSFMYLSIWRHLPIKNAL